MRTAQPRPKTVKASAVQVGGRCGTPMLYERKRAPTMVNIPRALFAERTGREARYHTALEEAPDWAYAGEPLAPLKGYPGVMWERPRRKPKRRVDDWSEVV